MKICSREYKLKFKPKHAGASFWSHDDKGCGCIEIGTDYSDLRYLASVMLNEIIEAVLYEDGKRFKPSIAQNDDHTRYVFHFDHEYLNSELCNKLLEAMLTSGFFKLADPRKKK